MVRESASFSRERVFFSPVILSICLYMFRAELFSIAALEA